MALGYVSHALARIPVLIAGFALEGIAGTVRWLGGLRDRRSASAHAGD